MSTNRLTEVLNYLSAMSREIGDFRAETKSRFDALETSVGQLEDRVGGLETRLDGFEKEMRAGFEQVRADIRGMSHKFDVTARDLFDLRAGQLAPEKRAEVLESKAGITDSV